jgi:hypothetical protein
MNILFLFPTLCLALSLMPIYAADSTIGRIGMKEISIPDCNRRIENNDQILETALLSNSTSLTTKNLPSYAYSLQNNIKWNPVQLRGVDFTNFTYPTTPRLLKITGQSKITVSNGNLLLRNRFGGISLLLGVSYIFYDKLTSNDKDDAVIVLSYGAGGSGMYGSIFIYTTINNTLKLIWSIDTGDRSDGGLRDVYIEKGNLIIETYNNEGLGACCTKSFTKSAYKWVNDNLQLINAVKVSVSETSASPIYNKSKKRN